MYIKTFYNILDIKDGSLQQRFSTALSSESPGNSASLERSYLIRDRSGQEIAQKSCLCLVLKHIPGNYMFEKQNRSFFRPVLWCPSHRFSHPARSLEVIMYTKYVATEE